MMIYFKYVLNMSLRQILGFFSQIILKKKKERSSPACGKADSEKIVYTLVNQSNLTEAFLIAITFCKIS